MQRTKAVLGLALIGGLAATGVTVAAAANTTEELPSDARLVATEVAGELPQAREVAWQGQVQEYVEHVAAHRYALAVYARAVNWAIVRQYVDALAAQAAAVDYSDYSGGGGSLADIRACESGGDYGAVSSSGTYRGAYQFDYQTWQSVGGSGDPAAASPEEQDMRAQMLYDQRGSSPWPNCG
jgi:hypothetical protein